MRIMSEEIREMQKRNWQLRQERLERGELNTHPQHDEIRGIMDKRNALEEKRELEENTKEIWDE